MDTQDRKSIGLLVFFPTYGTGLDGHVNPAAYPPIPTTYSLHQPQLMLRNVGAEHMVTTSGRAFQSQTLLQPHPVFVPLTSREILRRMPYPIPYLTPEGNPKIATQLHYIHIPYHDLFIGLPPTDHPLGILHPGNLKSNVTKGTLTRPSPSI